MTNSEFQWKNKEHILEVKNYDLPEGEKLPLLTFPMLEKPGVTHAFTTRAGGVSTGMFESLNLSFTRGDDKDAVTENYRRVVAALGGTLSDIVCSDQTHTTNVRRVDKSCGGYGVIKDRPYTDVDGLVTDEPGLILATFYADCVPLYFVDPVHHAIGLSHSGWRGTVGRMGAATLEKMRQEFKTCPEDVIAAIGPSICQECYEVSEDVASAFEKEFCGHASEILTDKGNGKYQLDLWKSNEIVMREAGITQEHLAVTNLCTCCNPKLLFSHRASHGKRGNLGAFLKLT